MIGGVDCCDRCIKKAIKLIQSCGYSIIGSHAVACPAMADSGMRHLICDLKSLKLK
jgi:hypothetical protein